MTKLLVDASESHREGVVFNGDSMSWQFKGDPQPTLDQNHRIRNGFDHAKSKKAGWELIASIDNTIALLWLTQYGIDVFKKEHMPRVIRLLNDPDWKFVKTVDETL